MNWDRIEGEWKQRRGKAVHHWGKMMNDELAAIAGKYEELVGRLQEKYGIASENSKRQIGDLKKLVAQLKKSNARLKLLTARLYSMKTVDKKLRPAVPKERSSRAPKRKVSR